MPETRWVRTNRRAPGTEWRNGAHTGRPGPWHIESEHGATWCGRVPHRVTINLQRSDGPPEGERRCAECVRRHAEGRPRPVGRR